MAKLEVQEWLRRILSDTRIDTEANLPFDLRYPPGGKRKYWRRLLHATLFGYRDNKPTASVFLSLSEGNRKVVFCVILSWFVIARWRPQPLTNHFQRGAASVLNGKLAADRKNKNANGKLWEINTLLEAEDRYSINTAGEVCKQKTKVENGRPVNKSRHRRHLRLLGG